MSRQSNSERIDLDIPQFDQSTFFGRLKFYLKVTDWRQLFKTDNELNEAKDLLEKYRSGKEPPETTTEQIWKAKYLYESAFHPDNGDKQNFLGRMSCQVPGGMIITGAMLTFYKTTSAVVFWQWINQSFNAVVNYTNRNANSPLTVAQMGIAYVSATSAALITALGLKQALSKRTSSILQRFVPFGAVAAANCVNIPLMRQTELIKGVAIFDNNGIEATLSKTAAAKGIGQVVVSRILMAAPGMTIMPFVMSALEKKSAILRNQKVNVVVQTFAIGAILTFMTPFSCAVFNQRCSIASSTIEKLEPEAFKVLKKKYGNAIPPQFYFNKGL